MSILRKNKLVKSTAALLAAILLATSAVPADVSHAAESSYDYSNAIYDEGTEDIYVYASNDKVVTTKTGIKRNIPKTTGKYDINDYPIPLVNKVPNKETFELIKAENKELMNNVETAIKSGTLTKHVAADGQFFGSISDEVAGVEKKVYINTNAKGTHSLASYVPAGEIATVTLSNEALVYAKKGLIKISVGMTMVEATSYDHNKDSNNRMPYLGKTFSISDKETKVGTPFGGMVFIEIDSQVPSGLQLEVEVKGVVDTPYYDLGQTTEKEWETAKKAPGLYAEIRTPYLRFIVPSYFIREVANIEQSLEFWNNGTALSATLMAEETRNAPMTLIFDDYITAGVAYASVGSWICNVPTEWAAGALDYASLIKNGSWGLAHEINHHYQGRWNGSTEEWGLGSWDDYSEITNNTLNAIWFILYTNIASYRGENGLSDWNKTVDPYSSLKQQIFEGTEYYDGEPNIGNFVFSTLAHEVGPIILAEIIKSLYDGATFHGTEVPAYDFQGERNGRLSADDRYDDFAYRLCLASKRDYTWYLQEALGWPLSREMVNKIKDLDLEQVLPVQSVYAMGEVGRETGRPYYVPSNGYVFDFEKSLTSPAKTTVVKVSEPKYGTLTRLEDGTYFYKPKATMADGRNDEFVLTVRAEADGVTMERNLNCTIGLEYNSVSVEHHAITKWNIYDALEALKTSTPYKTTTSSGMKIETDEGNNLAETKGYFLVPESGEYVFQAFGDDRAVFELTQEDGSKLQSLTEDYAANAPDAYAQQGATHFTVSLEANKAYSYTLICNNNDGIGWADVRIRKTSENAAWTAITSVCSDKENLNKETVRTFTAPEPYYVRPSKLAASDSNTLTGVSVISHPQGVQQNGDANSNNEGNPNNMVDGDVRTYFHSTYVASEKTPMPHEYIFDLGSEKSFNQVELLYRRTGDDCGVIGDYEIYAANEYNGSNTNWTIIASDATRKGNNNAPKDVKAAFSTTTARYVMLRVLNNRADYDLSILAEVTFSMGSNVKNVIAQNSSYIEYKGSWTKDTLGVFVNRATYNTKNGYFRYCFKGQESNLYVTKDTVAEVRIDGGKWKTVALSGSLREPSTTFYMEKSGEHSIEVRATGQELALNMISTDGEFYKGSIITVNNSLAIQGAVNIEIPAGEVKAFDALAGISYTDNLGLLNLQIMVSGKVEMPAAGTNQEYQLTYTVTDPYGNTATAYRMVTVTNQVPKIQGLSDITIIKGQGKGFDYKKGVTATDYEDGNVSDIVVPTLDLNTLSVGRHTVEYKAKDKDGNVTIGKRNVIVEEVPQVTAPTIKPVATPTVKPVTTPTAKPVATPTAKPVATSTAKPVTTPAVKPSTVKKLTATSVSTKQVKLTWAKGKDAAGYKVYRYNTKKKKYELIKTISKNSIISFTDSKLSAGTSYKYRVVAYNKGKEAKAVQITAATKPAAAKITKITTTSKKATVNWSKVTGASGYEVYRSTKKNEGFKRITTINKGGTLKYVNTKLKAKTTYYYKVRAYKTVNGKKVYGAYSAVKSIKVAK